MVEFIYGFFYYQIRPDESIWYRAHPGHKWDRSGFDTLKAVHNFSLNTASNCSDFLKALEAAMASQVKHPVEVF